MVFHTRAMRWRPARCGGDPRSSFRARARRFRFVSYFHRNRTETSPKPHRNRTETSPKPHRNRTETAPKPHRNRTETSPKPHRRAPSSRADRRTCRMSATSAAGVTPEMRDAAAMFSGFASLNFSRSSALRLPTLS